MEQFLYYLKVSFTSIKRAPLPYALTILILSLGIGVFFANATLYYQLNSDPLPHKSDKLFFPMTRMMPHQCHDCPPPRILSYVNVQKLSATEIPTAKAAMYSTDGYLRLDSTKAPTPVSVRLTQPDFFRMFDVPMLHGSVWQDAKARQELILAKQMAEKIFGRSNVVGEKVLLDDRYYTVIGVLDDWRMLPRLYDANNHNYVEDTEQVFMPLETGYDYNYLSNTQSHTRMIPIFVSWRLRDALGHYTNYSSGYNWTARSSSNHTGSLWLIWWRLSKKQVVIQVCRTIN